MAEKKGHLVRKRRITAPLILLVFCSGAFAFWRFGLPAGLLWHRSLDQVSVIEIGIMRFNETHSNAPASLEAVVKAKMLPETSSIYASCLKHKKWTPRPVSYSDSDYEVFAEGTDTVIRLKPAVLEQIRQVPRFRELNFNAIGERVDHDSRVLYGPDPLKQEGR
jgi:hypothetical protein